MATMSFLIHSFVMKSIESAREKTSRASDLEILQNFRQSEGMAQGSEYVVAKRS
jgi:hypothetical protein